MAIVIKIEYLMAKWHGKQSGDQVIAATANIT
jgi:hypothetical protein